MKFFLILNFFLFFGNLASAIPVRPCKFQNDYGASCISEDEATKIIQNVISTMRHRFQVHGWNLVGLNEWNNSEESAGYGFTDPNTVFVKVFGGAAKAMETSRDTLVMIVCHEIGHLANGLLPGYITEGGEGEADYFAASICAPDVFRSYPAFHAIESAWKLPEEVSQSCQKVYSNINIEICERVNRAGLAASLMLFRLLQDSQRPSFLTPDKNQVEQTNPEGTNSQCRLDTFYSGSLRNERPRCWYKP